MKVYACPEQVTLAPPDYRNYDRAKEAAKEADHKARLKAWLIEQGYKGKHTGKCVRFPVADGYAEYMLADGKKSCLIKLPYGDAWDYRDVGFLPKKEILNRIEQQDRRDAFFNAQKGAA